MAKRKGISLDEVLREELQRPAFAEAYLRRRVIQEIAMVVRGLRESAGLTQAQLAKTIGTSQPSIARLEKGLDQSVPRWDTLSKIALALGRQLRFGFGLPDPNAPLVEVTPAPRRPRKAPRENRERA